MTVLDTTRTASVLPPGRTLAAWHAAVSVEVIQHLSPAHAALLARPEQRPDGTDWTVLEGEWRRHADLPAVDREKLLAAVKSIRSDIRRLAESGVAPAVTVGWPVLWTVPDLTCLFAVAGQPVLTSWSLPVPGGAAGTVLDQYDDGVAFVRRAGTPWPVYAATLGALALFALVAGLVWPLLGLTLAAAPAQCTAAPKQLALMREQAATAADGDQLRTLLAALTEDVGKRQLQCPLPTHPAPQATPIPAPRHADLPQDQWDRRDVSMLEGCWTLTTQLFVGAPGQPGDPVSHWRMCFNRSGHGTDTKGTQPGRSCTGSVAAEFQGDRLHITEPQRCAGTLQVNQMELSCARVGDVRADCQGTNLPGGYHFAATFQR